MSLNRIPRLVGCHYDVEHAAREIAAHCVRQLVADKRPDRETNANATMHSAVLAEIFAMKEQLDTAIESALKFGLDRVKKPEAGGEER